MYKVNLHLLQACNFNCKGCFAHFDKGHLLTADEWKCIIDNLKSSKLVNSVNFAGGEPLLYPQLNTLIKYAKQNNLQTSIITNGSFMDDTWIKQNAPYLDMVGFSIDSFNKFTSIKLGRCDNKYRVFGKEAFTKVYQQLRNYDLKIKINTVISKFNYHEQFSQNLSDLKIDRWKILRMKAFNNGIFDNRSMLISDEEFNHYVNNNPYPNRIVESSMVNSYFIVDANGNLLDNTNDAYKKIGNLLREPFADIMKRYEFDKNLYNDRYDNLAMAV